MLWWCWCSVLSIFLHWPDQDRGWGRNSPKLHHWGHDTGYTEGQREAQLREPDPDSGPLGRIFIPEAIKGKSLNWIYTSKFFCHSDVNWMLAFTKRHSWCLPRPLTQRNLFQHVQLVPRTRTSPKPCLVCWNHFHTLDVFGHTLPWTLSQVCQSLNSVILTLIDRISKSAHFISLPKLPLALEAIQLLTQHVFLLHGIPLCLYNPLSLAWKLRASARPYILFMS